MKMLAVILAILIPYLAIGQIQRIPKLVIENKKTFELLSKDSTGFVVIDTLIMKDNSGINLYNKKSFKIVIRQAFIGKNCEIYGNNGKNTGTNLELAMNCKQLGSLLINVGGLDAKIGNKNYPNGDGGNVTLSYLETGLMPQIADKKLPHYIQIINKGGGFLTNAQPDLASVLSRINGSSPGRPLGQLPNGRVYSGNNGRDGKTEIKKVAALPEN